MRGPLCLAGALATLLAFGCGGGSADTATTTQGLQRVETPAATPDWVRGCLQASGASISPADLPSGVEAITATMPGETYAIVAFAPTEELADDLAVELARADEGEVNRTSDPKVLVVLSGARISAADRQLVENCVSRHG